MFKQLQQVGKAFMLPIAILPAAGLLLGIGGALSNKATVQAYPILNNEALQGLFQIMSAAGSVVFANLALLLCIGLGIGLAKRDKGVAALAAVVGYLIMTGTIAALIPIFSPDVKSIDTGVIGASLSQHPITTSIRFLWRLSLCTNRNCFFSYFCWISFLPHLANFPTMARLGG